MSKPVGPAYVGQKWSYTVAATDLNDAAGSLTYSLVSPANQAGIAFNATTRTLTWEPTAAGSQEFLVRVTDQHGGVAEQRFTIDATTVRNGLPPTITSVASG